MPVCVCVGWLVYVYASVHVHLRTYRSEDHVINFPVRLHLSMSASMRWRVCFSVSVFVVGLVTYLTRKVNLAVLRKRPIISVGVSCKKTVIKIASYSIASTCKQILTRVNSTTLHRFVRCNRKLRNSMLMTDKHVVCVKQP